MAELKTHKLWCQYNGCTHCGNSNGSGWENYSSHQTLYVLTFIGEWAYIYLLTLNKKQKMKIMGRVAWLIFVVVVSVSVMLCVLCCLQNNPVFLSVTIFHILKNENYELWFLANFFVNQITTGKNYDRKKRYCVSFLTSVLICHHISYVEKWKLWDIYLLSSWWLLCLCVLCFVFCAASKTIQCSQVSPYFIFWKMKNMSYVFWQICSSIKLRLGKVCKEKKDSVSFFGECSWMSPYFIF